MVRSSSPAASRVARRLLPLLAGMGVIAIVALALFGLRTVVAWRHHRAAPAMPGVTVAPGADGVPVVTSLSADGPAARAGIHVGDRIGVHPVRFHRGAAL